MRTQKRCMGYIAIVVDDYDRVLSITLTSWALFLLRTHRSRVTLGGRHAESGKRLSSPPGTRLK